METKTINKETRMKKTTVRTLRKVIRNIRETWYFKMISLIIIIGCIELLKAGYTFNFIFGMLFICGALMFFFVGDSGDD